MGSVSKRHLLVAVICLALAGSLLAGYRLSALRGGSEAKPSATPGDGAPARTFVKIVYKGCGHTLEPARELRHLPLQDILSIYPGASVTLFENGDAQVTWEVDGLCPEDAPYRLVCLKDGFVAVYCGRKPLETNLLDLRRDLPASRLSERDLERLDKGELVAGDAAVGLLLEGLLD